MDLIVRNGTILDGTGQAAFKADIGVKEGKIEEIGDLQAVKSKIEIDVNGSYVSPGFVDITNHADTSISLFSAPLLENLVRQGITTIIGGNCGVSLAPLLNPNVIHALGKWTATSSMNVNWATVAEFLEEVRKQRPSINFGMLVGYGILRRGITNEEPRQLSLEELATVKQLLKAALEEGALGLSSNHGSAEEEHIRTEEIIEVAKVLASIGGIYKAHLRDEGTELIPALNEALRIGAEAGVPVAISHLKAAGRRAWPFMKRALRMIENDVKSGHRTVFDISPYSTTNSELYMLLPSWAREGGFKAMMARLSNRLQQSQIVAELERMSLHYDRIVVSESEDGISFGKTIAELARRMQSAPEKTLIELLLVNYGKISIIGRTLHSKNVEMAIQNPLGIISSNGSSYPEKLENKLPHPRSYGAFPHFLHKYVREKKLMSWESAVIKCSAMPAEFMGLSDRGKLKKGFAADILVFNPDAICDRATYAHPQRYPEGISYVLVNGIPVVSAGAMTGERPGQIIKR